MKALTTVAQFHDAGLTQAADSAALQEVADAFKLRLSPEMMLAQSRAAATQNANDTAIARQFVPQVDELTILPEELADPIGDKAHAPVKGITHRYPDRVIFHVTHTCDVYCRFCFRREVVGEEGPLAAEAIDAALEYIAQHPAIREVILTGGDPLTLSPRRLGQIMGRLREIAHLHDIRIHTRVPVVAPERITPALIEALNTGNQRDAEDLSLSTPLWIVLHSNHADELTPNARRAITQLVDAGIAMVSQSVLLKGVNADADSLEALFRALIRLRVKPYYLHHGDRARGTSHFRTTITEGQAIMAELRLRLSGLALPTYVLDTPGGFGKVPLGPDYLEADGLGGFIVTDPRGGKHPYGR